MGLKPILNNVSEIPQGMESFYVQKDDKLVLDVEASDGFALENIQGLKNTLEKYKTELQSKQERLKQFEGYTPEMISELKEKTKIASSSQDDWASKLQEQQKKIDMLMADNAASKKKVADMKMKDMTMSILDKMKPNEESRHLLKLGVERHLKFNEDGTTSLVDFDGNPLINPETYEAVKVEEAHDFLRNMKEYHPFLQPTTGTGSGAKTSTGANGNSFKNPFKKGVDYNLTEASVLMKTNPVLAERLSKEAESFNKNYKV